jgi:hypothetical protein
MKIKLHLLMLFAIAIAFTACQPKQVERIPAITAANSEEIPDSVLVPLAEAKAYVKNYAPKAGFVDSSPEDIAAGQPKKKPDTRCIWFSKERLQAMLDKLEKEEGNGIRFYLAAYDKTYPDVPPDGSAHQPPKAYWGYNTLIMVSTKPDQNAQGMQINKDYYEDLENGAKTGVAKKGGFIVKLTPENRGEICPPPANCYDLGATLIPKN